MAKSKKAIKAKKLKTLGATEDRFSVGKEISREQIGYAVLSFFGGALIASSLSGTQAGKFTGAAGILTGGFGAWKKNLYATSFGAGMFFSGVNLPKPEQPVSGLEDETVMGIDFKSIADNTKNYFKHLGAKLMLKEPETLTVTNSTVNGLNGEEKEEVKYFLNPLAGEASSEPDLSELNAIEEQMDQMAATEEVETNIII
jgi:hypothetical protein